MVTGPSMTAMAAAVSLAVAAPGSAQPEQLSRPHPASVTLVSERSALTAGTTANLGVLLVPEPGWHLYWNGLNTSGTPIRVTPQLPEGFEARPIRWPAPERLIQPGGVLDHVYDEPVLLILPVAVPAQARPGSMVTISATVQWVVCREVCLVGGDRVELTLPVVAAGSEPAATAHAAAFAQTRLRLPRPMSPEAGVAIERRDDAFQITAAGATRLAFYPYADSVELSDPIADGERAGAQLRLRLRAGQTAADRLRGVLEVQYDGGERVFYEVDTAGVRDGSSADRPPRPVPGL